MSASDEMTKETEARVAGLPTLRLSRVFAATRRLVFAAWSKAEIVSRWFAPAPLSTHSCEVDLRPGGVFRLIMRTPDGVDFPMEGRFEEVVPPERIVFSAEIHGGNMVSTVVTFTEEAGKTRLDVCQTFSFESDATRGAPAGWAKTLDQLGENIPPA